jgi:hypothetical protein
MKQKFFFLLFILTTCILFHVSGQDSLLARPDTVSGNNTILIINSFDAMSMKGRKNKKELFAELADSLKKILYINIVARRNNQATVLPGLLKEAENSENNIFLLMADNNSETAIVITKLDVYFEQTGVEVTGAKHDKDRVASYDICSVVSYVLYNRKSKPSDSQITFCEHYTERHVVSGLLAVGPDIVGKKKDAFKIIAKNAERYLWKVF